MSKFKPVIYIGRNRVQYARHPVFKNIWTTKKGEAWKSTERITNTGTFKAIDHKKPHSILKKIYCPVKGNSTTYYLISIYYNKKCYTKNLHKIIYESWHGRIRKPLVTDHIDGNPLNNNLKNLQVTSQTNNCRKQKLAKNNTSGYKGVTTRKSGIFQATLMLPKKVKVHLGTYKDPKEAGKAYDKAALRIFGKWAMTNKMLGLL